MKHFKSEFLAVFFLGLTFLFPSCAPSDTTVPDSSADSAAHSSAHSSNDASSPPTGGSPVPSDSVPVSTATHVGLNSNALPAPTPANPPAPAIEQIVRSDLDEIEDLRMRESCRPAIAYYRQEFLRRGRLLIPQKAEMVRRLQQRVRRLSDSENRAHIMNYLANASEYYHEADLRGDADREQTLSTIMRATAELERAVNHVPGRDGVAQVPQGRPRRSFWVYRPWEYRDDRDTEHPRRLAFASINTDIFLPSSAPDLLSTRWNQWISVGMRSPQANETPIDRARMLMAVFQYTTQRQERANLWTSGRYLRGWEQSAREATWGFSILMWSGRVTSETGVSDSREYQVRPDLRYEQQTLRAYVNFMDARCSHYISDEENIYVNGVPFVASRR